ncbi:MAG TPA: DUF1329 domain-containing protein [Candidatus Binataceae bacterium]|nr:DUF1329 domain-containing protein [Candidatus Binataceae bacterium]
MNPLKPWMTNRTVPQVSLLIAMVVSLFLSPMPAWAQVRPGETITPESASKVRDLVSPGVYYYVMHGMRMDIIPTERLEWPPPYVSATEKYSGQVRLSPDHRSLVGYVAGQPFPFLDANDPYVATKIMWDNAYRPIFTDDYDLRSFDCTSQYSRPGQGQMVQYISVGHYAGYSLVGRTEVEPMPIDPDFLKSNRLWLFGLYPILAPADQRGGGILRYRYEDPRREDDIWSWTPGARRLRRMNESMMSDNTGAQTFDADHYSGFNAKVEDYEYRLLASKRMLMPIGAKHSPAVPCPYDNGSTTCPENWQLRPVYVVEAISRKANMGGGVLDSKNLLYMDSEAWWPCSVDSYNREGQLWRTFLEWVSYRDRPVPEAKIAIYPFKRIFVTADSRADLQSGFTSVCYLPSRETPEKECWYINMGAVDKEFFTTQAMVNAAP